MLDTKILLSIVIVAVIGVAAAGYQLNNDSNSGFWKPIISKNPNPTQTGGTDGSVSSGGSSGGGSASGGSSDGSSSEGGSSGGVITNMITPEKAQEIAQAKLKESPQVFIAGPAKQATIAGKLVYVVPIYDPAKNNEQVGAFEIDPITGEIIGVEGGAPG